MRWGKTGSLLALARELASNAEGLTLDEMAIVAGVNRRTAERMRDALRDGFASFDEIPDGRAKRFVIRGGLDGFMDAFDADELAELEAAVRGLKAAGSDARAALLGTLAGKVRSRISARVMTRLAPDLEALLAAEGLAMQPGPRPLVAAETLAALREALKGGLCAVFRYGDRVRTVEAWGLLFGRVSYFVGPAVGRATPVLWRLDRMGEVTTGPAFAPAGEFDLKAFAERSFGTFQEEPRDIALRFAPSAAADARGFLFHPTQTLTDEADGSLRVTFHAGGLRELAHHLFTWGDAVEILAPARLREEMAAMLRAALARHGAPPAQG